MTINDIFVHAADLRIWIFSYLVPKESAFTYRWRTIKNDSFRQVIPLLALYLVQYHVQFA